MCACVKLPTSHSPQTVAVVHLLQKALETIDDISISVGSVMELMAKLIETSQCCTDGMLNMKCSLVVPLFICMYPSIFHMPYMGILTLFFDIQCIACKVLQKQDRF